MVFASATIVTPPHDGTSSLAPVPSHGHRVHKDDVPFVESLGPVLRMDNGKQPMEEGFQRKRKWVVSVDNNECIPEEGLMVDARRIGHEDELFRINPNVDSASWLTDVTDRCRQQPLRHRFPVQWLNECLRKADWKELRQRGQGLPSLFDTMVCFYQVSYWPHFFLIFYSRFLTPYIYPFGS